MTTIDDAQDEVFASARRRETLQENLPGQTEGPSEAPSGRRCRCEKFSTGSLGTSLSARSIADQRIYFRDVYDDLVRIHDIVESLRDLISGALDTYLSVVSNRTNEIMKALTVVNVMFLPLTFIVGFFGMNFFGDTLMFTWPPLPKATLFWLACLLMIATPIAVKIFSRRRGWF